MGILQYNPHFNFSYLGQAWRGIRRRRWIWGPASLCLNSTCRPWCSQDEHCLHGLHAPRTDAVPDPDEPCHREIEDLGGLAGRTTLVDDETQQAEVHQHAPPGVQFIRHLGFRVGLWQGLGTNFVATVVYCTGELGVKTFLKSPKMIRVEFGRLP